MFSCFLSGFFMDLLRDNLRTLYRNYLFASCGGALILSVYGLADMAMMGTISASGRFMARMVLAASQPFIRGSIISI